MLHLACVQLRSPNLLVSARKNQKNQETSAPRRRMLSMLATPSCAVRTLFHTFYCQFGGRFSFVRCKDSKKTASSRSIRRRRNGKHQAIFAAHMNQVGYTVGDIKITIYQTATVTWLSAALKSHGSIFAHLRAIRFSPGF